MKVIISHEYPFPRAILSKESTPRLYNKNSIAPTGAPSQNPTQKGVMVFKGVSKLVKIKNNVMKRF